MVRVAERGGQPAVEAQEVHALRRPAGKVLAEQRREEAASTIVYVHLRMVCAGNERFFYSYHTHAHMRTCTHAHMHARARTH